MIYIKYTDKDDPTGWVIYAHKKGSKTETKLLNAGGDISQYTTTFNLKNRKKNWHITYLTKEEVERQIDFRKLELL